MEKHIRTSQFVAKNWILHALPLEHWRLGERLSNSHVHNGMSHNIKIHDDVDDSVHCYIF